MLFSRRRAFKALVFVATAILAAPAMAHAAASGIGLIDQWGNNIAHASMAGGFAMTGCGMLGILHHIHTGSWSGGLSHAGINFFGGVATMQYPNLSAQLGGTAAALIHPMVSHPAAHAVVHHVARLVS